MHREVREVFAATTLPLGRRLAGRPSQQRTMARGPDRRACEHEVRIYSGTPGVRRSFGVTMSIILNFLQIHRLRAAEERMLSAGLEM